MPFFTQIRDILRDSRNLQLLTTQAMVTQLCFGMFNVIWQPYLVDLGASMKQLGMIQGIATVFTALGSLVWGRLSDRIGRKPVIVGATLCKIVAMVFALTARDWTGFIGFGVFIGFSSSWMQANPSTTSLLSESVSENRVGTAISLYSSVGTIVAILSAPLGGVVAETSGYVPIFVSCMVGELFNTVMVSRYMRETLPRSEVPVGEFLMPSLRELLVPEKALLGFYILNMLQMFSWRFSFSNLNAILVADYSFSKVQLGLLASAFSIAYGLTMTPMGVIVDRHPKKRFLLAARFGYLAVSLAYLFTRRFSVFLVMQLVNGITHSFEIPAYNSVIIGSTSKENRATALGKLSTIPQIVSVPAPIIGGMIYDRWGFEVLVWARVLMLIAAIVVVITMIHPDGQKQVAVEKPQGSAP